MGLIAATITQQSMMAQRNDLEYKISLIEQSKLALQDSTKDLLNAGTDLDPENPAVKQLEERRNRLNLLEKKLDMQLAEYKTKLSLIDKNLDSANSMIDKSIK